ncbi:MAG: FAD:protein FMN transferase [Woeseiaceae bacterium]
MRNLLLKRFVFLLTVIFLVSSCKTQPQKFQDSFLVFGTVVNVTLLNVNEALAVKAFREIRADLKVMHRVWHVWEPGPLMRINAMLAYKNEFSAPPSVLALIIEAKKLAIQSEHLFNPAIGKLIALWGFHSHNRPEIQPSDKEIQKLLQQNPSLEDVTIEGVRMNNHNSAVKIDLGGVAKGYAVDRLLLSLKQKGIHNALIDTGGDLKVIGKHFDRPWRVAIRDPRGDIAHGANNRVTPNKKNSFVATIDLKDNEAAFTSGDYERYFTNKKNNDRHLHHIIDPRTGYPATGTQSVTVLHHNGATADAAATALFIAGPTQWVKIAKKMGLKNVLLIDSEGKVHLSKSMQQRVKFEQQREIIEVVQL